MGWANGSTPRSSHRPLRRLRARASVLEKLGITAENVVARAQDLLAGRGVPGQTPADTEPPGTPQG